MKAQKSFMLFDCFELWMWRRGKWLPRRLFAMLILSIVLHCFVPGEPGHDCHDLALRHASYHMYSCVRRDNGASTQVPSFVLLEKLHSNPTLIHPFIISARNIKMQLIRVCGTHQYL